MRPNDDPFSLASGERLAEVTRILATGILRLHMRVALSPDAARRSARKHLAKFTAPDVEVPDTTVLSVHNG